MNLENLFETQKVLRDRINYNEPDRFNKLILALLVELGELANEQRSWKFWSKDQTPRTWKARGPYVDLEDAEFYNPMLEEYVDCLHFILEIGLELGKIKRYEYYSNAYMEENITDQFTAMFSMVTEVIYNQYPEEWFNPLFTTFVELGEALGFTWEEVEQAYYAKNAVNHHRQEVGY
jgi:dimeric dUTPase (all-alpha-NTP-PPase superfamily)